MSCHAPYPRIHVNHKLRYNHTQCSTPRRLDTSVLRHLTATSGKDQQLSTYTTQQQLLPNKFVFSLTTAKPPKVISNCTPSTNSLFLRLRQSSTTSAASSVNSAPLSIATPLQRKSSNTVSSTPTSSPSVIREASSSSFSKNPFQFLRRLSGGFISHSSSAQEASSASSSALNLSWASLSTRTQTAESTTNFQRNCTPLRTPIQRRGVKRRCSTIFGNDPLRQTISLDDQSPKCEQQTSPFLGSDSDLPEVIHFDSLPPTAPKKRLTLPHSCGLDMPLRTSSLSSENLDSNANFNSNHHLHLSANHPSSVYTNGASGVSGCGAGSNSTAGVLMRHEGRRGSLNTNSSGSTTSSSGGSSCSQRAPRPATISYELSDDIRDKEIALTERRYGGRLCSQRAARIIQSTYREYRMRREYARIRSEKRTSRRLDRDSMQRSASLLGGAAGAPGEFSVAELDETDGDMGSKGATSKATLQRQSSVEDMVLEQAYWDWEKNSVGASSSGSQTPKRSSTGSKTGVGAVESTGGQHTLSRDSGVDAEECHSSPSGPSASNSTSSMNSAHSEGVSNSSTSATGGTLTPGSACSSVLNGTPPPLTPAKMSQQRKASTPARITPSLTHQDSPLPPNTPSCQNLTPNRSPTNSTVSSEATTMKPASRRCVHNNGPSNSIFSSHSGQKYTNACCHNNQDKRRKRTYRIGLNIFNKFPMKGIDLLTKYNFIDSSPASIARFLISRKGLSRIAIGEFLGNMKSDFAHNVTRQFMREIDLRNKEVDVALRHMMSYFQTPGESQKIAHILDEFNLAYVEQNLIRASAQFRNTDSIMVLCYAIIMLHTDMYNPNVRQSAKMTREDFVRNLRGTDDGEDMDTNLLLAIYDRVQAEEMKALTDHTDQVRRIEEHLTGQSRPNNLVQPHRRLVCYCRLFEVPDIQKKDRPGAHQRDVFLFNDMMLITKTIQKKKKEGTVYQSRTFFSLLGVQVFLFEAQYYPFGIQVKRLLDGQVLITLNTKSALDRERFVEDLQECVLEVSEMDRLRIEEELAKQQRSAPSGVNSETENVARQTGKHNSFSSSSTSTTCLGAPPPPHHNHSQPNFQHPPSLSRSSSRGSNHSSASSGLHPAPPSLPSTPALHHYQQQCCQHHRHHPQTQIKQQHPAYYLQQGGGHHYPPQPRSSGDSGLVLDMETRML